MRLEIARLVPPLRAGADPEVLRLGLFVDAEHGANARAIDRDGLLGEDVLAGRDRRLEVLRAEAGRRRQDDVVRVGREDLLVRVEADERLVVGHGDLRGVLLPQLRAALVQPILEGVAHRDERDAL